MFILVRRLSPAIFICHMESQSSFVRGVRQLVGDFMLQINLLNPGFQGFYKCFTVPLHLFTIKNLQAN